MISKTKSSLLDDEKYNFILQRKEAFERVFRSTDGKVVLTAIADQCLPVLGEYESDSHKIMFNEGKINILLMLLRLSEIPTDYFLSKYQLNKLNSLITEV